jgi:predicted ATPase
LGGGHQESKVSPNAGVERPAIVEVYKMLGLPRVYHFHDTSPTAGLHQTTYVNDLARLQPHAENLAAVLRRLSLQEPFYYRRIVKAINLVAPWFRDFEIEPFETKEGTRVALHWRGEDPDYVLKSFQLPDGGIRAIALITLLLQPKASMPRILLIDEPELGLHPFVLNAIAGLIRAAALECQIILGTQSQALVDHFEPQDIVVVEREKEGTTFARLDPERLQDWLEEYSLGELWEKNVIGGGPV